MPDRCSLLRQAKVIFVGTLGEGGKFRVTEAFKGVKSDYLDFVEMPGGSHFEVGRQYLIFADSCPWESPASGCLTAEYCSLSRSLKYSAAILEQLRAEKSGRRVAAVYGTLTAREPGDSPLPNILITLKSGPKSFEARTGQDGAYAFNTLPPGTYEVSADLPPNLELGRWSIGGKGPPDPFELPRRSCFENDLYVFPSGRISGKVVGPDGNPLQQAGVKLYRADQYRQGRPGQYSFQGKQTPSAEWKPFEFDQLTPGDYLLVFNFADNPNSALQFPTTFFPKCPAWKPHNSFTCPTASDF